MEYICNEEITIKQGNKQKTFKNYILSSFLEKYANNNIIKFDDKQQDFGMSIIYGYFTEEDIVINNKTKFEVPNFNNLNDIVPLNACYDSHHDEYINFNVNIDMENKPDKITYKYRYRLYDIEDAIIKNLIETQNQDYYGQKIGYLLFGDFDGIYAILDIREENIYYSRNNDVDIFRKDYIITDGIFNSDGEDGTIVLSFPYHLCCYQEELEGLLVNAKIESIGLGYSPKTIIQTIDINKLDFRRYKNNVFIKTKIHYVEGDKAVFPMDIMQPNNLKYPTHCAYYDADDTYAITPQTYRYSGSNIYPMYYKFKLRNKKMKKYSIFPKKNLPVGRYPMRCEGNYKYVIIKYSVFAEDIIDDEPTGENVILGFYTMAYELNVKDRFKINLKYERREK